MKFLSFVLLAVLAVPAAFAQKKEIAQLQRDFADLQNEVRTLQSDFNVKHGQLMERLQQILDASRQSSTSIAVLDSAIRDRLKEQLAAPVANLNTRLDQVAQEFQGTRESVADISSRMGRLQQQIDELTKLVQVLQAGPPAPPPSSTGSGAPPSAMSAQQLYDQAMRDRSGGALDLAMNGFQEYLKHFGNTELAPNAQFYIGMIHYDRNEYPQALQAFDTVLEKFSENPKTPDAMYMKGMTLLRSGQRNDGAKEFRNVIQQFPRSEVADRARAQLKGLGLNPPTTPAKSKRSRTGEG